MHRRVVLLIWYTAMLCYAKLINERWLLLVRLAQMISKIRHTMCPERTLRTVMRAIGYLEWEGGHRLACAWSE